MAMSMLHQHHMALVFGVLGNIISFMAFLAPVPTFLRIWRNKSTEGYQGFPYLVAMFSCMLWLAYALLRTDAILLISINSIGCCIELAYIIIFIVFADPHVRRLTIIVFVAMDLVGFVMIFLITHFAVPSSHRAAILGWICVTVSACVFAAPLSIIVRVIRIRSVEFMPITLSIVLTLGAVMWFAYGFVRYDVVIAVPNVLGFALGLVQIVLYYIYRDAQRQ